jgi:hypothetical protein
MPISIDKSCQVINMKKILNTINITSMIRYIFFTITLTVFATSILVSQTVSDAFLLSQENISATARANGVAGSMSALGADFSTLSTNPAGLASYRRSEFMISAGFHSVGTDASLNGGATTRDYVGKPTFDNFGFVSASTKPRKVLKTLNFAVGLNNINRFDQRFEFSGETLGSITDRYLELADGKAPEDLDYESGLAYDAFVIDLDGSGENFYTDYYPKNEAIYKRQYSTAKGGKQELLAGVAANINETIQLGITVGAPLYNYQYEKTYRQTFEDGTEKLEDLTIREDLNSSGIGINLKGGLIFKPIQEIRIGLAVHTPTVYYLSDKYYNYLAYDFIDPDITDVPKEEAVEGSFDYKYYSPVKANVSIAGLFGKSGFLSAELEYADYSTTRFDYTSEFTNGDFKNEEDRINDQIREEFGPSINLKFGGEYALNSLRLRAGMALLGSPYQNDDAFNTMYTGGIGWRGDDVFVDFSMQFRNQENGYYPYLTADGPEQLVQIDANNMHLGLTVGFKL